MLGLLKSGKLELRCASDRGDLLSLPGDGHENPNQVSFTRKLSTIEPRNPLWTSQYFVTDRATRCWSLKRSEATAIYHWKRWNRIGNVSGIKIIREQGEWSSANKTDTNFKCYRRWRERNILWFGECSWLWQWNQLYSWERITWQIVNPSRTLQMSHAKKMFDISTKFVSEQDEISWVETIGCENHSWKYLSLVRKELIFNAQRSTSFQILYCVSVSCWKKKNFSNRTMHGNKDWDDSKLHKISKTLRESTSSQRISSGFFP